ncbi:hypothetical protein AMQ68_01785 [Chryseobacterium sp. ERMR1:04]|nr:hypothetical protein AMQ68_01785 [Chryseobacterium sp. ERMR1:04]
MIFIGVFQKWRSKIKDYFYIELKTITMSEKEKKESPQPIKKEEENTQGISQKGGERSGKTINSETAKGGTRGG